MNPSSNRPSENHDHSLSEVVLSRIEQEKVTPTPRWTFTLKERLMWAACLLALVVATISAGAALYTVLQSEYGFRQVTHGSFLGFVWHMLPLLWLAFFLGSIFAAYEYVRHTGKGYRYSFALIVLIGGVIVCVGACTVYATGLASKADTIIEKTTKGKAGFVMKQQKLWTQPEKGLLAGEVVSVAKDFSELTVRTFDGVEWTVSGEDLQWKDCRTLLVSKQIRLVGLPVMDSNGQNVFHACFALPWEKPLAKHRKPEPLSIDPQYLSALDERKLFTDRSTDCKGLRAYEFLQSLRNEEALIN